MSETESHVPAATVAYPRPAVEDARPRPTVSIFSVNRDPGRVWKYIGSLLIVLGSIMLFAVKYRKARVDKKKTAPEVA